VKLSIQLHSFPGIAGLAVTYGINLNAVQSNLISYLCNLENKIISVERILQYTSIPSEAPLVIKDSQLDHSWPSFGEIRIQDLQVRHCSITIYRILSYMKCFLLF